MSIFPYSLQNASPFFYFFLRYATPRKNRQRFVYFLCYAKTEAELNENQERKHPETTGLTTSYAVKLVFVESMYFQNRIFVSHLRNFAKFAKLTENLPPITSSPKAKSADQQVYALHVCNLINDCCGNPNHEIAADLASAVFNVEVDAEKVKKWWQRRGDKSQ